MSNIPNAIMYLLQSQPNQAARERLIANLLRAVPNGNRLMILMSAHRALTNMPNTPAVRAQRNQLGRLFNAVMRRPNGASGAQPRARRNGANGGNSAGINALLAAAANMNNNGGGRPRRTPSNLVGALNALRKMRRSSE
jgi:hypothetical protein